MHESNVQILYQPTLDFGTFSCGLNNFFAYVTVAKLLSLHSSTFSCKPIQKGNDDFQSFVYSVCI